MTLETNPHTLAQDAAAGAEHLSVKQAVQKHLGIECTTAPVVANWGNNQSCKPKKMFYPTTIEDCQTILKEARELNLPVRCIGKAHAWSYMAMCENGYMISMTKMNDIQPPKQMAEHDNAWCVTVQAGVTFQVLDQKLRQNDPPLALATSVVHPDITVGGALSVGAYGPMTNERSVSDLVCELTLLNSSGELCHFSPVKDEYEFSAACCSLGAMGILYSVTLRLVPMATKRLAVVDSYPLLESLFPTDGNSGDALKKTILEADGTELLYWPFEKPGEPVLNARIWMKQFRWTDRPLTLAHREPPTSFMDCFKAGEVVQDIPDALHFPMGDGKSTVVASGYTLKCDDDFSNVVECFNLLLKEANQHTISGRGFVMLEVRFLRASKMIMSHSYDKDPNALHCCMNMLTLSGIPGFDQFSNGLMAKLMEKYPLVPQWSKDWENIVDVKEKMKEFYGDRLMQFDHIRRKYDIHGIFLNKSLLDLF
ncbi:hypothetical protein BGW42_004343 [Actinomortierella wolfii]|nr:hypothetical protein BGW42_004343 [Actinomortierella wolfii]